ncbi:MAG: glutathione S-transferase [Methylomonas sp.]
MDLEKNPILPIFYSFRRCPYAMRARLAIAYSGVMVELREIELKNKPEAMLNASPKGTVPVLVLEDGQVIDESFDIMRWALQQNDPANWLSSLNDDDIKQLIAGNDGQFKQALDRYKYADRYPAFPESHYRQQGEIFLAALEQRLNQTEYLSGANFAIADAAILPFIRQFAAVDSNWFNQADYPKIRLWLQQFVGSSLFAAIMGKYPAWQPNQARLIFNP